MIKAHATKADGTPLVILGISGENVTRLIAGEPINVQLADLSLPPTQIVIVYGKTEQHIVDDMTKSGLLPADLAVRRDD